MADVATLSSRDVYNKIHEWEKAQGSLAPLSTFQRNVVLDLSDEVTELSLNEVQYIKTGKEDGKDETEISSPSSGKESLSIESTNQFLRWYSQLEDEWMEEDDAIYTSYHKQLIERRDECANLLAEVESSLNHLNELNREYRSVSNKTNSLHQVSEQLLADQMKLSEVNNAVNERMQHFKGLARLAQRLESPAISVTSDSFVQLLDQLDDAINYMKTHSTFKECSLYLARYQHCLTRAVNLVRSFVFNVLIHATEQTASTPSSDVSHYARFQASAHKVKPILSLIEQRSSKFHEYMLLSKDMCIEITPEKQMITDRSRTILKRREHSQVKLMNPCKQIQYENLLSECQQCYLTQRESLIGQSVMNTITELAEHREGDHCSLTRSACAFLIHVSQDELRLYQQFFTQPTPLFIAYLETLCTSLYDTLRPLVVHMKHLETLAELCSILRLEMLQEQVQNNPVALEAFGHVAKQLLQDVQERLVFRAHLYLKTDIAQYNPSPGDLAYPEKLEMMESIAQSMHEQEMAALSRSESRASLVSIGSTTSLEVARINTHNRPVTTGSPGDLHGMWYPPVRRTLVCLSRLYRCVERPIFQGLSQEALTMCIQSIGDAAQAIKTKKTTLDGELFQIKHLLILREQIAPFQVDFTVKEMSFDFSKMKTADFCSTEVVKIPKIQTSKVLKLSPNPLEQHEKISFELLQKRSRLFSSNALLQFLLEGSPVVREQWIDSRKDVDRQLKSSCEAFIADATNSIISSLSVFLEKVQQVTALNGDLRTQPWSDPTEVSAIVQETSRNIKTKLPVIQRSMQLYLANRDTEFILYRPIKNNVVGALTRLQTILNGNGYSMEDKVVIACPTPEQVTVLLSSASLLVNPDHRKQSTSDSQH